MDQMDTALDTVYLYLHQVSLYTDYSPGQSTQKNIRKISATLNIEMKANIPSSNKGLNLQE